MNVIQEINNINDKFATQGSKLRIEKRGEKLNIRGSLPSKEDKNKFKIQRIALGIKADISGSENRLYKNGPTSVMRSGPPKFISKTPILSI